MITLLLLVALAGLRSVTSDAAPAARPDAAPSTASLSLVTRSKLLRRPTAVAPIPGSQAEAVVLTQGGFLWRVKLTGNAPIRLFGDVSSLLIKRNPVNEEGLIGIAFSPTFTEDGHVYLDYVARDPRRIVVSRFDVVGGLLDTLSERPVIMIPKPYSSHNGGQLAFGPDGMLYVGVGDGGNFGDPRRTGQRNDDLLASILRLDVSAIPYRIPADNPFVGDPVARPELYAYGLRNPWRFSFDAGSGDLWAGDVGQGRWEEVNIVRPGGNYGWSRVEGYSCFNDDECDIEGLEFPELVYGHDDGCAIIGGFVYHGRAFVGLQGRYVFGDFCAGTIWAYNPASGAKPLVIYGTGVPIVGLVPRPDGELLVLGFDGSLWNFVP